MNIFKGKNLIIVLLVFIIIVLLGYLVLGDKIGNNSITNETTENTKTNNTENKDENSNFIALYNGYEFDNKSMSIQDITSMELTTENKSKYNTTFYNYFDSEYIGSTVGKFDEDSEEYEGYGFVKNVEEFSFSKKYNAFPRKANLLTQLPTQLSDMEGNYKNIDIIAVDLDGDDKTEYIVRATYDETIFRVTDEPYYAYSIVKLLDSEYKEIATLVEIEDGFWDGIKSEDGKVFIERDDIKVIDVDDDGIMEIIICLPVWEGGMKVSIVKYNNGKIIGETNIKPVLVP